MSRPDRSNDEGDGAMSAPSWREAPVVFDCEGCRLVGIVTQPPAPAATGVVIVVGGPQYRAGSHRQFTLLARHLADNGIASLRFDYRGMGDSEGERRSFEEVGPDIRAAVDTLLRQSTTIQRVALWGLCDAASAAAMYAHTDPRIAQLILLNPWVEDTDARTRLKAYYPQRVGQTRFWARLLSLDINILTAIKHLLSDLSAVYRAPAINGKLISASVKSRMLSGLKAFCHETVVITSERDLTGQAFCALIEGDTQWRQACKAASFIVVAGADHTFSTRHWRDRASSATVQAILSTAAIACSQPVSAVLGSQELVSDLIPVTPEILGELEPLWLSLEAASDSSIFQSWLWVSAWIAALPNTVDLRLLKISHQGEVIGLGVFGRVTQVRHGIIRSRMLCLSETGQPALDRLTVEHNDLLMRPGWETKIWQAALDKFTTLDEGWDEIRVSGISNEATLSITRQVATAQGLLAQAELSKPYFWVDLNALRFENQSYLNALSGNTRQQIRKSLRLYAEQGPLELSVAQSLEQALAYFGELKELHQRYWRDKGQPGAFATDFANQFHRGLITKGVSTKQVQLIKVRAGDKTVGILYNLVHAEKVCNYQAGLVYDDNPKLKPGLACHALAVEMNIAAGKRSYDFLMGDTQYKRSLSTHQNDMHWLSIKRPTLAFAIEEFARRTKQKLSPQRNTPTDQ